MKTGVYLGVAEIKGWRHFNHSTEIMKISERTHIGFFGREGEFE